MTDGPLGAPLNDRVVSRFRPATTTTGSGTRDRREAAESAADHGRRQQSGPGPAAAAAESSNSVAVQRTAVQQGEPADPAVRHRRRHHQPADGDGTAPVLLDGDWNTRPSSDQRVRSVYGSPIRRRCVRPLALIDGTAVRTTDCGDPAMTPPRSRSTRHAARMFRSRGCTLTRAQRVRPSPAPGMRRRAGIDRLHWRALRCRRPTRSHSTPPALSAPLGMVRQRRPAATLRNRQPTARPSRRGPAIWQLQPASRSGTASRW